MTLRQGRWNLKTKPRGEGGGPWGQESNSAQDFWKGYQWHASVRGRHLYSTKYLGSQQVTVFIQGSKMNKVYLGVAVSVQENKIL